MYSLWKHFYLVIENRDYSYFATSLHQVKILPIGLFNICIAVSVCYYIFKLYLSYTTPADMFSVNTKKKHLRHA